MSRRWPRIAAVATASVVLVATAAGAGVNAMAGRLSGNITALNVDGGAEGNATVVLDEETGEVAPFNVLLMGSDTRTGKGNRGFGKPGQFGGERSDTTILLHVSADRSNAIAVSIPRDTLITLPKCEKDGKTVGGYEGKFNAAFELGGPGCTMKAVEEITGLELDHFMVIDFGGFKNIVDAVGGVEICLENPVNDPQSGLNLPAGKQVVQGKDALAFVRARKSLGDGSDTSRIRRQQAFLSSLVRQVLSSDTLLNPASLIGVLDAATKSLTADPALADPNNLRELAMSMQNLRPGNITFTTMPWYPAGDGANVLVNKKKAKPIWQAIANDTSWPPKGAPDQPVLKVKPDEISVNVLNGTGVTGAAKAAAKQFRQAGFNVINVGNADTVVTQTTVQYDPRWDESLKTVVYATDGVAEKVKKQGSIFNVIIGPDFEALNPIVVSDALEDKTANLNTAEDKFCAS